MRISDWSSDVCSSYLHWACSSSPSYSALPSRSPTCAANVPAAGKAAGEGAPVAVARLKTALGERALRAFPRAAFFRFGRSIDRKSAVEGQSVSVRVDLGGPRTIKKKKRNQ